MIALLLACCLSAPPEITIDTDTVTLGAIVAFPAGDPRAPLSLGSAPQPGLARRFQKQELTTKISIAGLPVDDLQLPESVLVRRKSQGLDPEEVSRLVRGAFDRQFPDADITITSIDTPIVDLATGKLELTASLPDHPDPSMPIYVILDIHASGFSRKVFVKTVADIRRPQPALRSAITANMEIHASDLEWKVLPVRGRGEPISDVSGIDGMHAKHNLAAGDVLTADLLFAPILVRKGEVVTVKATNGGVTITAVMRARSAAHLGETIFVEHLAGAGSTSARVIGPGLLEAGPESKGAK